MKYFLLILWMLLTVMMFMTIVPGIIITMWEKYEDDKSYWVELKNEILKM